MPPKDDARAALVLLTAILLSSDITSSKTPTEVARAIITALAAAGQTIVATELLDELKDIGRKLPPAADTLIEQLTAQAQRIAALETALRGMLPRYVELFEAAGLGRAETDSVAVEAARQALGEGRA